MNTSKNFMTQNVYKGIVIGVLTALGMSLIFTLIFTWLILGGKIGEDSMKFTGMITTCVASFSGAAISVNQIAKQRFLIGAIVSLIYFAILLMSTALFFEGQYQNIVTNIVMVLIGSVLACVIPFGKKKQVTRIRKKRHYR